ncbi:MAG: transglycosylase SLT domain-containing protein [Gemmatimonadales bacterium]
MSSPPRSAAAAAGLAFAWFAVSATPAAPLGPASLAAQDLPPESGLLPATRPSDPAAVMLRDGFALTATRELTRRLSAGPVEAEPEQVLLAARAGASARAWPSVLRLLTERSWLDSVNAGEGRLLIAHAFNAEGQPRAAITSFEKALASQNAARLAPSSRTRMEALVGLAQAYESTGQYAEAAARYAEAATGYPTLEPWLLLSALQTSARGSEPAATRSIADVVRKFDVIPRDSVWIEVVHNEFENGEMENGLRFADSLSARAVATLTGERIAPALLARGDTVAALARLRRALATGSADAETGDLLVALDDSWRTLGSVADADARAGRTVRALRLYEQALDQAPDSERPELTYEIASVRFTRGEYRTVERLLTPWIDAPPASDALSARALFLAGRARYRRGLLSDARDLWRRVAEIPTAPDGAWAAFMLADMHHDAGRTAEAIEAYERTVANFPNSSYAGTALFRLGMLAMLDERPEDAIGRFDEYRRRSPGGNWYHASIYWGAKAREAAGDSGAARAMYREALGYDPLSYYGIRAGQALGLDPWEYIDRRAMPAVPTMTDEQVALVKRMNDLRSLGWRDRGLRELWSRERAGEDQQHLLALAIGLNENGWSWQGTGLAQQVLAARGGLWNEALLRAVYPLIYAPVLQHVADETGLDPSLMAAVIRRESQFDREVRSPVGATGLMQLMPSTAAELARRVQLAEFESPQLRVPEVNMTLGARYLSDMLDRYGGSVTPALISYNAGPHRYTRWREYPEFRADAELAIERIPFSETRVYVKTILAYRYIYQRLWGLGTDEDGLASR